MSWREVVSTCGRTKINTMKISSKPVCHYNENFLLFGNSIHTQPQIKSSSQTQCQDYATRTVNDKVGKFVLILQVFTLIDYDM